MSITGTSFLLFLLVTVVLYYVIPKYLRWIVLLAASIAFYLSFSITAILYLAGTVLLTYLFSLWLSALDKKPSADLPREKKLQQKQALKKKKRIILALALVSNFSTLVLLKYTGFLTNITNNLFSVNFSFPSLLLPLGISFYIFQSSSYLIDIYRSKYPAQKNLATYALFVCFFPQMVQGPINRYNEMSDYLYRGNTFDWENIRYGMQRMIYGILKKAMIADILAPIVAKIYGDYDSYPGIICFLGAALYCIQLYCDFSGGIDLMLGASALFGIPMQENFRQPYLSASLDEFWRRWHISLGEWMKDYLFYPVTLSRFFNKISKRARKIFPASFAKRVTPCLATILVFLAVGMWQGPGWANIAYGLWNGFWMSLGLLWGSISAALTERHHLLQNKRLMLIWGIVRTNILVIFGRYFSNASSFHDAVGMLRRTLLSPLIRSVDLKLFSKLGFTLNNVMVLLIFITIVLVISLLKETGHDPRGWLNSRHWILQFGVLVVCIALLIFRIYANGNYTPIAYVYENI